MKKAHCPHCLVTNTLYDDGDAFECWSCMQRTWIDLSTYMGIHGRSILEAEEDLLRGLPIIVQGVFLGDKYE